MDDSKIAALTAEEEAELKKLEADFNAKYGKDFVLVAYSK